MHKLLDGLRAAGETTRLRVLALLSQGELTVTDLTEILGQSQPRVSRHLKLLGDAGLVSRHREGSWVLFRIADHGRLAALGRFIVSQLPEGDAEIMRDRQRADALRNERAARAARYFSDIAPAWDRIRALHMAEEQVEAAIKEAIGPDPVGTILDLGTGTGRMLEIFADQTERGIGLDNSQEMLTIARDKLESSGRSHLQVRQGDLYNLPYDNDFADLVVIHQVLHFLDAPQTAILEAARVMNPGGRLLIVDLAPHDHDFMREKYAHQRLGISSEQVEAWLDGAGLTLGVFTELAPQSKAGDNGISVLLWLAEKPETAAVTDDRRLQAILEFNS